MIRKVEEKLVGTTCKNNHSALKHILQKKYGDGEVSEGSQFIFNYKPTGSKKPIVIRTEPTNDSETRIKILSIDEPKPEYKSVGQTCSNNAEALNKLVSKDLGDGTVTGGSQYKFTFTMKGKRGEKKTIHTEPTSDSEKRIRVKAIESVEDEIIKDVTDLVGNKTSGSLSCYSEKDKMIIKKELESRGYTVEISSVTGGDSNVDKYHIEYYKKATECNEKPKRKVTRKVTEGAGAGYSISAKNFSLVNINKLDNPIFDDEKSSITFEECDIDVTCDVDGESYEYGGDVEDAKAKITSLKLNFGWDSDYEQLMKAFKEDPTVTADATKEIIKNELYSLETKSRQGGGWFHVTFGGLLAAGVDDIKTSSNIESMVVKMTDENQIKFMDRAVDNGNSFIQYAVYKDDGIEEVFEKEEDAIKYAKENDCDKVEAQGNYISSYGGDVEPIEDDFFIVWSKDNKEE